MAGNPFRGEEDGGLAPSGQCLPVQRSTTEAGTLEELHGDTAMRCRHVRIPSRRHLLNPSSITVRAGTGCPVKDSADVTASFLAERPPTPMATR